MTESEQEIHKERNFHLKEMSSPCVYSPHSGSGVHYAQAVPEIITIQKTDFHYPITVGGVALGEQGTNAALAPRPRFKLPDTGQANQYGLSSRASRLHTDRHGAAICRQTRP